MAAIFIVFFLNLETRKMSSMPKVDQRRVDVVCKNAPALVLLSLSNFCYMEERPFSLILEIVGGSNIRSSIETLQQSILFRIQNDCSIN